MIFLFLLIWFGSGILASVTTFIFNFLFTLLGQIFY
jgi:hypothetical protein